MYRHRYVVLSLVVALLSLGCLGALSQGKGDQKKEGNGGILYGEGFAFGFQAPPGWVLDNQVAVDSGLDAVFYPRGQTWQKSPVVAYCLGRPRTAKVKTAADAVQDTLADMHRKGNPNSKATKMPPLKLKLGGTAEIYYYTGDKFGNYEAAAYIVEEKTISYFILTSRKKDLFTRSIPAFQALVKSYFFLQRVDDADEKSKEKQPPADRKNDPGTL